MHSGMTTWLFLTKRVKVELLYTTKGSWFSRNYSAFFIIFSPSINQLEVVNNKATSPWTIIWKKAAYDQKCLHWTSMWSKEGGNIYYVMLLEFRGPFGIAVGIILILCIRVMKIKWINVIVLAYNWAWHILSVC